MIESENNDFARLRKIVDDWNNKTIAEYNALTEPQTQYYGMFNPDSVPDKNFYDCKGE